MRDFFLCWLYSVSYNYVQEPTLANYTKHASELPFHEIIFFVKMIATGRKAEKKVSEVDRASWFSLMQRTIIILKLHN